MGWDETERIAKVFSEKKYGSHLSRRRRCCVSEGARVNSPRKKKRMDSEPLEPDAVVDVVDYDDGAAADRDLVVGKWWVESGWVARVGRRARWRRKRKRTEVERRKSLFAEKAVGGALEEWKRIQKAVGGALEEWRRREPTPFPTHSPSDTDLIVRRDFSPERNMPDSSRRIKHILHRREKENGEERIFHFVSLPP